MASTIRIAILANARDAIRGFRETTDAARGTGLEAKRLKAQLDALNRMKARVTFKTDGFVQGTAQIVAAHLALDGLRAGLPDLTFGLDTAARRVALVGGAVLAATAGAVPFAGAALGIASALGAAAVAAGLFGAVAAPTIKAVTGAVGEYTTASHAFDRAQSIGDTSKMVKAQDDMRSALGALTPVQRAAADQLIALNAGWDKLSASQAPAVLAILGRGAKALTDLIGPLAPAITAVFDAVSRIGANLFNGLTGSARSFAAFITTQGVSALTSIAAIIGNLAPTIGHLAQAFAPLGNTILRQLGPATAALRAVNFDAFAKTAERLLPIVERLLSNVGGAVGNLVKQALPLAGPVLQGLGDIAGTLRTVLGGPEISAFVASIGQLVPAVAPIVAVVVPVFAKFAAIISGQLLALVPLLLPLVQQLADVFVNVLAGLSPLLSPLLGLVGVFVSLLPTMYPTITALREAFVPVVGRLGDALRILAPTLPTLATAAGQIFVALAPLIPVVAQLAATFGAALAVALTAVAPLLAAFSSWAQANPAAVTAVAVAILSAVTALRAMALVSSVTASLRTFVLATGLATTATAELDAALIANPIGITIVAVAALAAGIAYLATQTQFFQFVWGSLVAKFNDVVNLLKGVGANLVNGLISGLTSAWHYFTDRLTGLTSQVPAAIRKVLGIASPSRVMHTIGTQITAGLAGGIVAAAPALNRAVTGTAASILAGLSVSPSIDPTGLAVNIPTAPAGGAVYQITVNVAPGADPAEAGRQVVASIEALERRTGRLRLAPAL